MDFSFYIVRAILVRWLLLIIVGFGAAAQGFCIHLPKKKALVHFFSDLLRRLPAFFFSRLGVFFPNFGPEIRFFVIFLINGAFRSFFLANPRFIKLFFGA